MNDRFPPQDRDEILDRLRAADPVAEPSLPAGTDPGPQALLASVMAEGGTAGDEITGEEIAGGQPEEAGAVFASLPEIRSTRQPRTTPRRWQLLTAAAAVVALVAGFLVFSPDNTPTALAAVHQAAEATAETGSGQIDVSFSVDGTDGGESAQVAGLVMATFAGADLAVSVELTDAPTELTGPVPDSIESRLVDGTLYANDGTQWYSVEAPTVLSATLLDLVDPRSVLARVQELVATEEVGPTTVDGVATTHYRSTVDLGDASLAQAEWLPVAPGDIDAEGDITVDLFVDDDGLLPPPGALGRCAGARRWPR